MSMYWQALFCFVLFWFVVLPSSTYSQQVSRLVIFHLITYRYTAIGRARSIGGIGPSQRLPDKTQTLTGDKHPYSRWNSNPQNQQALGRRPTPWTVRPLGSALTVSVLNRNHDKIRALLRYNAASCGNCLLTFRDNVSVSSSRVKSPRRKDVRRSLLKILFCGMR
jgi:hypothetical protein